MALIFDGGEWSEEWTEWKKESDGFAMGQGASGEDKVVVVARSQEEKSDFHKAILIFLPS